MRHQKQKKLRYLFLIEQHIEKYIFKNGIMESPNAYYNKSETKESNGDSEEMNWKITYETSRVGKLWIQSNEEYNRCDERKIDN